MSQPILSRTLPNGLVLVAEPMPWLESAAFTLAVPAGCVHDPLQRSGLSSFTCEMAMRGAGQRDSRSFIEELDRLNAHVGAARALLKNGGAVGRKLDFLAQEFNREANTLCSKSNDVSLTSIGLELKTAVDQFREQVQNIE